MTRRIRVYIGCTFNTSSHIEYHDLPDDWDKMTTEEQDGYLNDLTEVVMSNYLDCGATLVDDKGDDE